MCQLKKLKKNRGHALFSQARVISLFSKRLVLGVLIFLA